MDARGTDSKPNLVFINRFFWPDQSATGQLLADLAFTLALHDRRVTVITSRQRYDKSHYQGISSESVKGVVIKRVWTSHVGGHSLLGRISDYLTFYLSAMWRLWRTLSSGDIVVTLTDPPLICIPAALVAFMRGAKLIIWHQDLFPEVASSLGIKGMQGRFAKWLLRLRNKAVRHASVNVVLSPNMAQHLIDEGNSQERIRIIPNWSDGSALYPTPADENPLRAEWGLRERFVVGYSGNMGRVHEFSTLLDAAERLRENPLLVFLFIGGGHYQAWIESEAKQRGLSNVMFRPYQSRENLVESLGVPDVHIISLRQQMDGLVFPSKLYGILAAGRPAVFIGAEQGDVARILRSNDCGLVLGEGDAQGVAQAILKLQWDPERMHAMGSRARALFEREYEMETALLHWCQVLTPLHTEVVSCQEFGKMKQAAGVEARVEDMDAEVMTRRPGANRCMPTKSASR